jgi:hypothetical protein
MRLNQMIGRAAPGLTVRVLVIATAVAWSIASARITSGAVDVTVGRVDPKGTGANLAETLLNTSNVNPSEFGKLFGYEVEGFVYAQPLIVSGISIRGHSRNVLYVATTNNILYALDADEPGPDGGLLWWVRFSDNGAFAVPATPALPFDPKKPPYGHMTVQGDYGILSTPVIDRGRNAIYIVVRTVEPSGYVQRLHSLDLASGRERPGSPVEIKASMQVDGHTIEFNPQYQMNRSGLALAQSKILIAFTISSKIDEANYRGWVVSYNADTLRQTGAFCTSSRPISVGGGVWQAGRPPAVDNQGNVYYFVGNGWPTGRNDARRKPPCDYSGPGILSKPAGYYGQSLIKLDPANSLRLAGSWSPTNWCELDNTDNDLGGSGPALIDAAINGEHRTLAVGGGKAGALYVIDVGLTSSPDIVAGCAGDQQPPPGHGTPPCPPANRGTISGTPFRQGFCVNPGCPSEHHVMGGPVYWPRFGPLSGGSLLYVSVENDPVRAFEVSNSSYEWQPIINPMPRSKTSIVFAGHPGAILSLSADGEKSGSGILWANFASNNTGDFVTDASFSTKRGQLAAFDAENLNRVLWTSDMQPNRDGLGYFAKFNPPTIANGKVYIASFPAPEPYAKTLDCDHYDSTLKCVQFADQTYSAPDGMGQIIIYGLNPPAKPPVRSFVSDVLPAILNSLRY